MRSNTRNVYKLLKQRHEELFSNKGGPVPQLLFVRSESLASLVDKVFNAPDSNPPAILTFGENSILDWDAHRDVKSKQLLVQSALSHGIALSIPFSRLDKALPSMAERGRLNGLPADARGVARQSIRRVYDTTYLALKSLLRPTSHDNLAKLLEEELRFGELASWRLPAIRANSAQLSKLEITLFESFAAIYAVGRFRRAEYNAIQRFPWLAHASTSAQFLRRLRQDMLEGFRSVQRGEDPAEVEPERRYRNLRSYYILRDCSRSIASNAANLHEKGKTSGIKKILLIDSNYRRDVNWRLNIIKRRLWNDKIEVHVAEPEVWVEFSRWFQSKWAARDQPYAPRDDDQARKPGHREDSEEREKSGRNFKVRALPAFPIDWGETVDTSKEPAVLPLWLSDYNAVLIDTEVDGCDRGPELIYWIESVYRSQKKSYEETRGATANYPRVLILSDSTVPETLQQSLNLGVEGYVSKDRIFDLPYFLRHVQTPNASEAMGARNSPLDFQAVHMMPSRLLSALQAQRIEAQYKDDGELDLDPDRKWIRDLPKADLHYHIGTSISLETIGALALSTSSYLLPKDIQEPLKRIAQLVAAAEAKLASTQQQPSGAAGASQAEALWSAARSIGLLPNGGELPEERPLEQIVKALWNEAKPIGEFEVASLLVATIVVASGKGGGAVGRWRWVMYRPGG